MLTGGDQQSKSTLPGAWLRSEPPPCPSPGPTEAAQTLTALLCRRSVPLGTVHSSQTPLPAPRPRQALFPRWRCRSARSATSSCCSTADSRPSTVSWIRRLTIRTNFCSCSRHRIPLSTQRVRCRLAIADSVSPACACACLNSVVTKGRLPDGTLFPMPITLDINEKLVRTRASAMHA